MRTTWLIGAALATATLAACTPKPAAPASAAMRTTPAAPVTPAPQAPPASGKFIDVSEASGIPKMVRDRQAEAAKVLDERGKPGGWWMTGIFLGDLDNDGALDFVIGAHGRGGALVALNDGKGHFTPAAAQPFKSEVHVAFDANEDGKLDLTMTYQDGGGQWWLNHSTPGKLDFQATPITRGTNTSRLQVMLDFNRDGKVDWTRGEEQRGMVLDVGDGKGGFTNGAPVAGAPNADFFMVDIDGDGHQDLLVTYAGYDNPDCCAQIWRADGKGGFVNATADCGIPTSQLAVKRRRGTDTIEALDFAIKGYGDFNQDGSVDLLVLSRRKTMDIYLNDGKGHFTKKEGALQMPPMSAPYGGWGIAVMTDFDNDGIPDIITNGKHWLKVFRGLGGGNFEYMNQKWGIKDVSPANVDEGLCFGDIDNDGMLDIIGYTSADDPKQLAVYHNDLPRQNFVRVRPLGLPGNKGAAGAKIRVTDPATGKLIWYEPVAIYCKQSVQSYYGSAVTERHFGLGQRAKVDVSVEFYPSGKKVAKKGVAANTTVEIQEP